MYVNKSHCHDDISVRMVKICVDATKKSLLIINNFIIYNCIKRGLYPSSWKKSLSQFSRKDVSRYALFLPISGKIFEKFFFNSIFEYVQENGLLCDNQ